MLRSNSCASAEDHADTRDLVALLLRRAGFEVAQAATADDALALSASARFDLYCSTTSCQTPRD